ncbi:MAG: hypothetical protein AAFS03_02420 [Pseudomonadota bacterium]
MSWREAERRRRGFQFLIACLITAGAVGALVIWFHHNHQHWS